MEHYQISYLGDLRCECVHSSGARLQTDAPKDNEGKGEGFSPTDLFAASLGTCMLTVMAITARHLGLDLHGTSVDLQKEMSSNPPRRIARLIVRFRCPGHFAPSAIKKLEQAAVQCPVHYSLHPDIKLDIDFLWGV
ncbi:MAG: OsmC-like protein [Parachlamydiales bacterium]|nr:OsmC-like protein [Parachlamydiales bacterium]